jgi:ATP-dependent helicase/nuclease subunit B
MTIAAPAGDFLLHGRADRIDVLKDGTLSILDFKTGTPPTASQVLVGFAPQLGLEAAMAQAGAFVPIAGGLRISELGWIGLGKIGRTDPFSSAYDRRDTTADQIAETVFGHFTALIGAFDDPARAYQSQARPMFVTRYESPYDHLARVREWGLVESEEDLAWLPPARPG